MPGARATDGTAGKQDCAIPVTYQFGSLSVGHLALLWPSWCSGKPRKCWRFGKVAKMAIIFARLVLRGVDRTKWRAKLVAVPG
jgi:hypothetical protein